MARSPGVGWRRPSWSLGPPLGLSNIQDPTGSVTCERVYPDKIDASGSSYACPTSIALDIPLVDGDSSLRSAHSSGNMGILEPY
jgi:hypothetical protein